MKRSENNLAQNTTSNNYVVVNGTAISEEACNKIVALYKQHKVRIEEDSKHPDFNGKVSRLIRDIASTLEGENQSATGMALSN